DAEDYVLPDTYQFMAPKGCGGPLNRLLSTPTKLRDALLAALDAGGSLVKDLENEVVGRVQALASSTDCSMFRSVELHDALETHAKTKFYVGRFGAQELSRSAVDEPPAELGTHETNYVVELRKVYAETCDDDLSGGSALAAHPKYGEH